MFFVLEAVFEFFSTFFELVKSGICSEKAGKLVAKIHFFVFLVDFFEKFLFFMFFVHVSNLKRERNHSSVFCFFFLSFELFFFKIIPSCWTCIWRTALHFAEESRTPRDQMLSNC